MDELLDARPAQARSRRPRRRSGLLWATLTLLAVGGLLTVRRAVGPAILRYRLERVDRGPILSDVTALGRVFAVDLSRVQLRAIVSEADVGRVAVGESATLYFRAPTDCLSTGTVSEVRPSRGVEGYTVLVEADNQDHKLLLGMAATVSIEVARRDGVLRVPLGALSFVPPGMESAIPADPHVGRVFVLEHGRPRPVRVTVGLEDLRHAELVAGALREGDAVIVDPER